MAAPWRLIGALRRFVRGRIFGKILTPFAVLLFVIFVAAAFIVSNQVSTLFEQRFANQLVDAGTNVNSNVLKVQSEQVELIRLMANTEGVDAAIQAADAKTLQQLLVPVQVNSQYNMVDVVNTSGTEVLALRPPDGPLANAYDPNISQWDIVQKTVANRRDDYGNKYAELVNSSFGEMFYSGGPVLDQNGTPVGAILVGLPIDDLLKRLTKDVLANVTVYDARGAVVQSTLPLGAHPEALTFTPAQYTLVTQQRNVQQRQVTVNGQTYLEVVGGLFVRDSVQSALGVAIPSTYIVQSSQRTQLIIASVFAFIILGVILIALWLGKSIESPLVALVRACQRVAMGNLDEAVPITTEDETGTLTGTFNEMMVNVKDRNFVRDTFGRYMTKEVSEEILKGEIRLGGERRIVTMLMSDIRSFTTISETMEPENLVAFLNRYFRVMVDCIDRYGGVVDKFMGDAILVKFGAPVERPDHARRAVLTALAMRQAMFEFNEDQLAAGHQPIRIGIGINTGEVIVGNIGAESRMEYTVIGDTVNATQRTEDLTKDLRTDILLTESTAAELEGQFDLARPYMLTLRGRRQQTAIYPILGLRDGLLELVSDAGPVISDSLPLIQEFVDSALLTSGE